MGGARRSPGPCRIVERTDLLRRHGYPVPQHFLPIRVESGVVLFQEAVSGAWRDGVDPELVQECLRLNDLQADRAEPTEEWNEYISRSLTVGLGNYCIHESLADYSRETRQILAWVRPSEQAWELCGAQTSSTWTFTTGTFSARAIS